MTTSVDQVMVSVTEGSLPKVLDDLREAGLVVDTVLEALGVVTGTVEVRSVSLSVVRQLIEDSPFYGSETARPGGVGTRSAEPLPDGAPTREDIPLR